MNMLPSPMNVAEANTAAPVHIHRLAADLSVASLGVARKEIDRTPTIKNDFAFNIAEPSRFTRAATPSKCVQQYAFIGK